MKNLCRALVAALVLWAPLVGSELTAQERVRDVLRKYGIAPE